jgi:hypothetical protein
LEAWAIKGKKAIAAAPALLAGQGSEKQTEIIVTGEIVMEKKEKKRGLFYA